MSACSNRNMELKGVSGKIVLCGSGFADVPVTLSSKQYPSFTASTDSTGSFHFNKVWAGKYTVTPQKPGYTFNPSSFDIDIDGEATVPDFITVTSFSKTYGGVRFETGYSVQQTSDCGYIAAGFSGDADTTNSNFYIVKVSAAGETEWTVPWGGSLRDVAYSVKQIPTGEYLVAGVSESSTSSGDSTVLMLNADGSIKSIRSMAGSGSWLAWDEARSISLTSDGGFVLGGITASQGSGATDAFVQKWSYDTNGNLSVVSGFTWLFGEENFDYLFNIIQLKDSSRGYIFVGSTEYDQDKKGQILIRRIDSSFASGWTKRYPVTPDNSLNAAYSVDETVDGFVVAGFRKEDGLLSDGWIVRLDTNGDEIWNNLYGGIEDEKLYSIKQAADGGFIAAGYKTSASGGDRDGWILRLDATGDILWEKTYPGKAGGDDAFYTISPTEDGGYVLTGYSWSIANIEDMWILKIDANGEVHN